jgi:DNA-binding NtrC family response regulator
VRVIAASNRELLKEVDNAQFRSDLFYRLAVFQIVLPPLRERVPDIKPLAKHFISIYAARMNKPVPEMSSEFLQQLETYPWKGNIRELKNILERTLIISDNSSLHAIDLPFDFRFHEKEESNKNPFDLALIEKHHIQKVLNHTQGNKSEAARLLNIGLTTLYRKMDEYRISSLIFHFEKQSFQNGRFFFSLPPAHSFNLLIPA